MLLKYFCPRQVEFHTNLYGKYFACTITGLPKVGKLEEILI